MARQIRFVFVRPLFVEQAHQKMHGVRATRDDRLSRHRNTIPAHFLTLCGLRLPRNESRNDPVPLPKGERRFDVSVLGHVPADELACPHCLRIYRRTLTAAADAKVRANA